MTDFGSDISCVFDSSPDFKETSGNQLLGEAIARRWITDRGELVDDPNYGFNVAQFLNADVTQADIVRIQVQLAAEAKKDERVSDCAVTVTFQTTGTLLVTGVITAGNGPFSLVLAVSDVTVQLLTVG